MKNYLKGTATGLFALSIVLAPLDASAQVYNPTLESQRAQVRQILDIVQAMPSYTDAQLTQKIQLLKQALELQLAINASGGQTASYDYAGTGTGTGSYNTGSVSYDNSQTYDPYSSAGYVNSLDYYSPAYDAYSYNSQYNNTYGYATYYNNYSAELLTPFTAGSDLVTPTSVRLLGSISRKGQTSDHIKSWFEWSIEPSLTNLSFIRATAQTGIILQSGTANTSAPVNNLVPNTIYYYRLVVSGRNGSIHKGDIKTFRTALEQQFQYYY